MSVHYKFKAALDFSTVTFDGIHISVAELKKAIIDQKRLGKNADFDLQIINAQTKEVYSDENALIPKNTSVMVARIPVTDKKKSGPPPQAKDNVPGRGMHHKGAFHHQQSGAEVAKGSDLSSMDLSEEEKIKAMMTQSTADYDPSHYVRIRGANQHGRVPDSYRCNKCNQGGHWISRCPNVPNVQSDVKKSTGIPRSFMVVVDSPDFPGALMTPEGRYAVPAVDHAAYLEKNKGQQTVEQPVKPKIPDDLVCPLCNDLLTDALLVPCCANSYCDDCIRSYLLESDHECPGCHEKDISPTSLIPNRFLRGTVNAFKSDTGYSKPEKVPERPQKSPPKPEHSKAEEPRKLSLDELPDDLFPHSPKKIDSETEGTNNTDPESTKDLYDFNDGSIPSPFASPKRNETRVEAVPNEQRAIQSLSSRPFHGGPPPGMMRGGPPQGPPQPHHPSHQMSRKPHGEPPPPGFDVLPPGEDGSHRPPPQSQGPGSGHDNSSERGPHPSEQNRGPHPSEQNRGPHPSEQNRGPHPSEQNRGPHPSEQNRGPHPSEQNRGPHPSEQNRGPHPSEQNRGSHPSEQNRGPPQHQPHMSMPPNVPPPFNPMQPPPGYPGGPPPGHGHPQGPPPPGGPQGLPPPGYGGHPPPGPNQNMPPYSSSYNRPPPHMSRGPPPGHHGGPPPRHHMDHDDFGHRGRGRRPYGHGGPPHRMEEPHRDREDESRLGIIDDPLKEFERIMREKDRRKKMAQTSAVRKRSKSRSFSPAPRRISPYPPKRSRSRSFSRSPSPKRKRPPPAPKRRRSYSRSTSRSPRPLRRVGKSRSRSRNRSITPPPPPPQGNIRRSPRRAPPQYSPSPPARFTRKEKEEYFEGRGRERYEERSRFAAKQFAGREYESKYDGPASNKYDSALPSKHDILSTHKSEPPRQQIRSYHGHVDHESHSSYYRDKQVSVEGKKPFENFDPNVAPPGTDNTAGVPSLLDIKVSHPNTNIYPISTIGTGVTQEHNRVIASDFDSKSRREKEHIDIKPSAPVERKKSNTEEDQDSDKDHRQKRSPAGKKHKKEKRKHKKKNKDDKKPKKRKSSKDERPAEGEKSSDDEHETETTDPVKVVVTDPPIGVSDALGTLPLIDNGFAARQTAPCDSTVKSPDRSHDVDTGPIKIEHSDKHRSAEIIKRRESQSGVPVVSAKEVPTPKSIATVSEELRLPASKWDEYEDYIGSDVAKIPSTDANIPISAGNITERIVTPDVIKKAENVIFDKPLKPLPDPHKPVLETKEPAMDDQFVHETKVDLPSLMNLGKGDLKISTVASAVYRKSAKDRLGSKITEDEAILNVTKSVDPSAAVKSKISAITDDSARKKRSRSRSPYSGVRYRNRSRSRSLDRLINRSRQSSERHVSKPSEREQRSPSNRRRERKQTPSRERRRSQSGDRRRSKSRDKRKLEMHERRSSKDRMLPMPRDRAQRSASKGRERRSASKDRRRSSSRDRAKRPSSRDRDRRRPSPKERDRDRRRSRSRRRSQSRSRDRRSSSRRRGRRSRSPHKSPRRRTISRDREQKYRRPAEKFGMKDDEEAEKRRFSMLESRKEAFSSRAKEASMMDQDPSPEARVFQQIGADARPGEVFSPTLKKQKGRINIKLSSISKTEPQLSGSSSSDDEHGDSKLSDSDKRLAREEPSSTTTKTNNSRPILQSTVSVVSAPITSTTKDKENKNKKTKDGVPGEEGKRKKKRTHSPTSTKSSSSSDTKRKKKKKDKKKKKKKKKSKE